MSKHSVRNLLFTCSVMALACAGVMPAHANPLDGSVAAGSATIVTNGKNLDITQSSDKAVIDWRGFDIAPDESTNFYQPNSGSITLNRVNSTSPSMIEGKLTANGNVFIVNKNGVVFGGGAQVDVNGLVVSTADITNENFMNGQFKFDQKGKADAKIVNQGTITAKDAGLVGFVAPNVENSGVIVANLGRVHLASGDTATVDLYGDGLMEVQASDSLNSQIVKNTGTIKANGGKVALTAAAGRDIVNSLIQADGVIHAQSVGVRNGEIIIGAKGSNKTSKSGKSKVVINGTLDVSGKKVGQSGGKVTITGDDITLSSNARIDASGKNGGGSIKIGGDYQGSGTTQTAKTLTVDSGSIITNDAIETGNGGTTILWSDGDTVFRGLITARGGSLSGNGGFAEVSGKSTLLYSGLANLSATNGEFGTLLLDPTDITISSAADSNTTGTAAISGTAATSNINVTTLQNQLAVSSVVISTSSAYGGNGDITILNNLSWSSGRTLTLSADRDIKINAMITTPSGNNGLTMTAGRDILFNANVALSGSGLLSATATRNLTVGAGTVITSGATGGLTLRAAGGTITNAGLLTLSGNISMGTGNLTLLSGVDGSGNGIDLTLNSTNLQMQAGTFGAVNATGFRDININRAITSSNTITLGASRDLITAAALSAGTGTTYSLTAGRDIVFGGNITGAGGTTGIVAQAGRNLTINSGVTLTPSSTGAISLKAAGGVTTNAGILTINGVLNTGNSSLTLTSGLDGLGNYTDLTLNSTNFLMQNTVIGAVSISGFRDIMLNRDILSSSGINITASRNLTVNNGVTIKAGSANSTSLYAANNVAGALGILTMNGILNLGSGSLSLFSGIDASGNRPDLILNNTNLLMQGSTIGTVVINGFRDINLDQNITTTGGVTVSLTADRDLIINNALKGLSGNSVFNLTSGRDMSLNGNITGTGSGGINATASRNLTVGSSAILASGVSGATQLKAANNVTTGTGILTINGTINAGSNSLVLTSGLDAFGNAADLTLNSTNLLMQGATIGTTTVAGFNDINLNTNIAFTGVGTFTANRNLTIGSGAIITSAPALNLTLRAANNSVSGSGIFTLNGIINMGTATLSIVSGLDGSGNRADLTFNNSNFLMQGATIAAPTISGFRDITFNRSITSSGAFGLTAARNLTIGSGATIAGTSLTLYSAGGSPSANGSFILNGTLNAGSGNVTITSGLDTSSNRTDLTFNNTNFLMQNGAVSSLILVGFQDINLNRDLSFTGNTTINAGRNLTVGSGATITAGSGQGLALTANSVNGVGILTLNGIINMGGTGSLTLTSGTDASGNRADITLNNSNLLMQLGRVGTTTINGFRDITVNRDLLTNGSIALTAYRNLTIGNGVMLQSANNASAMTLYAANNSSTGLGVLNMNGIISIGLGNLILTSGVDASGNRTDITLDSNNLQLQSANFGQLALNGFRDITLNRDINVSGSIVASAYRNLTVGALATIAQGTNSALSLKAANGVITDTGVLTLNGKLNVGGGSVILTSGVDASGHDIDLTLDSNNFMMQGATFNGANITGFRDVTINTTMTSNNSNIVITANRNLTVGSSAVFQTNNGFTTSLKAAGGNINSIGLLTYHGKTNLTNNSVLSLLSGVDASGNRSDLTIDNTNYVMLGATTGPVSFTGFRDVNLNTSLISSQGITVVAQRDLNLANGITIQSGPTYGIVLQAAGGLTSATGSLNLNNSILNTGSGSLTLASGVDSSGNRTNLILDNTNLLMQGSAIGTTVVSGFHDITINRDIVSNGHITLQANHNLTINSTLQSGPTWGMILYAAGGTTTNSGSLVLNGKLIHGSYIFDIRSGLDSSGNRVDLTLNSSNFEMQNPANGIGNINIVGFRDITLNTDIITAGGNTIIADRNLTIGNGVTVKSSAAHFSILQAAGGDTSRLGILTNNGIINTGAGNLTLTSGLDSSGNRADLTLNNSNLITQGTTVGLTDIQGFRDITIDKNINSSSSIRLIAYRNLTINNGTTLSTGNGNYYLVLRAAGGDITNVGHLNLYGTLIASSGSFELLSGIDASGNRLDLTLDNSNLQSQTSNFGNAKLIGYRDITVNRDILGTGYVDFEAARHLTVQAVKTGTGNSLKLSAADGNINNIGVLTINGKMTAGNTNNPLTLISGVDATGNRTDLTLNGSNFEAPNNISGVNLTGFRDISIDTDLLLSPITTTASNSVINAARDIYFNHNLSLINSVASTTLLATAGRDIKIASGVSLTGGNGTTLVAGRNFINNSGTSALSVQSGRWLVYSSSPEGIQTGGLAYNFQSFGCNYGSSCTMGSGNGFLYKQTQAEHDYNQVRSEFKDLPKTVEYVSQIPVVSYTSTVPIKTAYNDLRNDHSIYTIDKALSLQLQLDSDDTE